MSSSDEKINQILDSAYQVFGTKGFYETTMSEIAEKAGIAKGSLYLYFSSKEELFKAMSKRDFDQFLTETKAQITHLLPLYDQLKLLAMHQMDYFYQRKGYRRLFFQAPNSDPELWEMFSSFMTQYVTIVAALFEREGFPEPELYAKAFSGLLNAYKMDILFIPELSEDDLNKRVSFIVDLFFNGSIGSQKES